MLAVLKQAFLRGFSLAWLVLRQIGQDVLQVRGSLRLVQCMRHTLLGDVAWVELRGWGSPGDPVSARLRQPSATAHHVAWFSPVRGILAADTWVDPVQIPSSFNSR